MLSIIIHLLFTIASAAVLADRQTLSGSDVCQQIRGNITGEVYFPLSLEPNFKKDIEHYMTSSTQIPMCVVEVASDADVSTVIKIIGSKRIPWGVKSGGHASNPGFSSTPGVFISLARLTQVTLSEDQSTVELGTGNRWTDVYTILEGTGVNVVGGRVVGPGVGGFSLGGGYSWLTDQYGLTCDTVVSYNLVLPNGTITKVDSSNPDLFFALKGGLNRFGIVTSIVLKTVPQQNMVYGGIQIYGIDAIPGLINATNKFQQENTDDKAQVILTINGGLVPNAILISFYDGPTRPAAFDPFNNVGAIPLISNVEPQSFASFAKATPSNLQAGYRGAFHTMMTTSLTVGFMQAVYNESSFYGALAILHSGTFISYDIEPFTDYGRYATDSAFPHASSPLPLNLYFAWTLPIEDAFWRGIMQQSIDHLTEVAKREGIYSEDQYAYPNYALSTYGGAQLYGPTNAARLRAIQTKYDPNGVMLLADGFNI
ncbi:putative fad binding domain-containing protein [Botrytis fragariae]|uniref:Putative fad binding domain-containing protein n=1 Tax=Botrytis fragariae TaxID=1964551 RepID=A0A8H6EHQ8_9HELO|nr:putative fad binding domain-containing protein [Botrytis fragariae]KAF5872628.1 putative fad binding domain-containing protein [Botrytis fragariae]